MDSKSKQEISKFKMKDGILALCMFLLSVILTTATVAMRSRGFMIPIVLVHIANYTPIVIIILIVLRNKQGLASIGLHKEKLWPAVRLGLLFSLVPILFGGIIPGLYAGFNQLAFGVIVSSLAITLLFAAWEDILYAGFVTPRLYGFVKSGWFAIPLGALIFAVMHVPTWILMERLYFGNWDYAWLSSLQILRWFIAFLFYFAIFRKYYSIVPIVIIHTVNNFMMTLVGNVPAPFGVNNFWIIQSGAKLLAACALFWYIHKSEKKHFESLQTL
ncbi:MAG: CPBP family intramembrane metalloprotease [Defluviitaleaceae bacterium]|nr:CPBP family intramembrane metalloprotease [Defluviitaleaceae bacterium]MCL2836790.1 CPBP family intramembrane metalloprotease [Defluviitaleaceae bacterium]